MKIEKKTLRNGRAAFLGATASWIMAMNGVAAEPTAEKLSSIVAAAGPATSKVEEIVVTAEKRQTNISKTPIAITAFSPDTVKTQAISDFRDLSGKVPGLLAPRRSTAYSTQTYAIRGIGEIDTYPDPSVAVYVDDVFLARTVGSVYDTADLERVEVLRGPQGTLYGRNSNAGAIRFITKDPDLKALSGEVSAEAGNLGNIEVRGRINVPIVEDKVAATVSIVRHKRDGYTYDVPQNRYVNDLDFTALRAKLKAQLSDKLDVLFSVDGALDRSTASYYTPHYINGIRALGVNTNPDLTWADATPLNHTTVGGLSLRVQYQLNDNFKLKSVTAWRGMHGPINYDNDGQTFVNQDSFAGFHQWYQTQEFNLNGDFEKFNFVAGLYYFYEFFNNHRYSQTALGPVNNVGLIQHTDNDLRTRSLAAFGQVNYKATDKLTLTLGGRYTRDDRSFRNFGQNQNGRPLVYPFFTGDDYYSQIQSTFNKALTSYSEFNTYAKGHWTKFSPKAGIEYQWTQDILTYFNYSQGFKAGGYDLRATTAITSTTPYSPEVNDSFELGVKSKFLDGRVSTNLAVFLNKIKDFQLRTYNSATGQNLRFNAGRAESKGVELEVSAVPLDGLRVNGALAYLKTKYKNSINTFRPSDSPDGVVTSLIGLDFPLSPKWQASASFTYDLPLSVPGTWRIAGDLQYETHSYPDLFNTAETIRPQQYFVNGSISYTTDDDLWSVALAGKNLFDNRYNQSGSFSKPGVNGSEGYNHWAPNEPRTVNLSVTRKF